MWLPYCRCVELKLNIASTPFNLQHHSIESDRGAEQYSNELFGVKYFFFRFMHYLLSFNLPVVLCCLHVLHPEILKKLNNKILTYPFRVISKTFRLRASVRFT